MTVAAVEWEAPVGIEKRPFRFLSGLATAFISALWLLMAYGFSTMIDPTLPWPDWWPEFLDRFAAPGLVGFVFMAWGLYLVSTSLADPPPPRFRQRPHAQDPQAPNAKAGVWDQELDGNL